MALFQMLQDDPHVCQASDRQNGTQGDHFQKSVNLKGWLPHWGGGQGNQAGFPRAQLAQFYAMSTQVPLLEFDMMT